MSDSGSNGTTEAAFTIEEQDPAPESIVEGLRTCLQAHNEAASGLRPEARSLSWVLRGADGALIGGLAAEARYGWLHVRLLWVNADRRERGAGRALMAAAEDRARALDLHGLLTDTSSFQAPGFYARCGFEIVGEVPDLPPGYTTYYLMKRLKAAPPS
jgi:ribosomal protein S18 acetylase RimI-like enzyme